MFWVSGIKVIFNTCAGVSVEDQSLTGWIVVVALEAAADLKHEPPCFLFGLQHKFQLFAFQHEISIGVD